MEPFAFPDNTVLINFAILDQMDLLEKLMNGRGRWCATVAQECERSARRPGLELLATAHRIFGKSWAPQTRSERLRIESMRLELARPGDRSRAHLGEAETLGIIVQRRISGYFVTDDREAARLSARHGVRVVSTWDLHRVACHTGKLDADSAWSHLQLLKPRGRGTPPHLTGRAEFDAWLSSGGA